MDINKVKWAAEESALKVDTNSNQRSRGWDTSDGTITGNPEQPTLQTTNGWMHAIYKWLEYINSIRSPIGTILTSALSEEQFNSVTTGSWVLCDGRNVSNSSWSSLTSQNFAPDLRGYILGGAGSSGITITEKGSPVEDLGIVNQYIDDSVSLRSLSATAEAGNTDFEVGGKAVYLENIIWEGTTNTLNNASTQLKMGYTRKDLVVDGVSMNSWVDFPLACLNREDDLDFTVTNFQHRHKFTGKLTGRNIVGASKIVTVPETPRSAYSDSNPESYNFVPNSVGVSYFLRID